MIAPAACVAGGHRVTDQQFALGLMAGVEMTRGGPDVVVLGQGLRVVRAQPVDRRGRDIDQALGSGGHSGPGDVARPAHVGGEQLVLAGVHAVERVGHVHDDVGPGHGLLDGRLVADVDLAKVD
jgi:hypothetical protein